MKRFYKLVSHEENPEGCAILLDGRAVKTKSGALLYAQNEEIANEIVREWAGQGEEINPDTMPFTQILNTRIDQVSKKREAMSVTVLKYIDTDLICYPTDMPQELYELQEQHWGKWREWIKERFGYDLFVTTGLNVLEQKKELKEAVTGHIDAMSDDIFTLLQVVVPLSGSLVLGLALIEGQARADEIFKACFVEEHYKDGIYMVDEYGRDPLSEHKQQSCLRDLETCETYRRHLT
ncbi:MAG: ATP12 chaperone family protein [Alphaproteobacteria bacterium]|nr:ATP12 chaperone family protein [Alphaproteobacteria bacterium]